MTDNTPQFDIFGSPTKDDIKVGYISTDRGFVSGVTICEANDYAKLNPGTLFIFRNRKEIKYIDINQVNELTTNDLIKSFEEEECSGIQVDKEISEGCSPRINLFGGGGLGVLANPVVGRDGSILAVDVVEGGFGYKYPPSAKVKDPCGIGAGAELKVTLVDGDETDEVIEYTDEEDFEDYKICDDPLDKAGFGRRYSLTGKDIGKWDPNLYLNDGPLPFNEELKKYIDFLSKVPKPWWTTRTEPPLKTTSDGKISRAKYDVYHWAWGAKPGKNDPIDNLYIKLFGRRGEPSGLKYWKDIQASGKNLSQIESAMKTFPEWKQVCEGKCKPVMPDVTYGFGTYWEYDKTNFMNSYAISPVPMSNVVPSDFGGKEHYFEWEIFFPHMGEYVFKFQCDNKGALYIDGEKQGEYKLGSGGAGGSVLSPPEESKVSMTTGLHRIRIDVFNGQKRKKVNKQDEGALGDLATGNKVDFKFSTNTMYANTLDIDGLDISVEKKFGDASTQVREDFSRDVEYGRVYDVKITSNNRRTGNLPATNKALVIDGKGSRQGHWRIPNPQNPKRIEFDDDARADGSGFDVNATFTIDKGNGTWAADGKSIKGTGEQTITLWWSDRRKSGRAINSIKIGSTIWKRSGSSGSVTHTFTLGGGVGVIGGENNLAKLRTKGAKVLQMEDIPGVGEKITYDDLVLTASQGRFYDINGLNAKYTIGDRPATSTGKSTEQEGNITTIFNSTDYIDKANRKLWRTNPVIAKDSGFTNKYGITPFDPTQFYESSMAGTHTIKWHDVNFPVSGEYEIGIGVDDNVRLIIGNEVNIYKEGFVPGTSISTGTSSYRRFITAGSYTIIAELDQTEGGKLGYRNVAGGGTQTATTTEFDYRAIYYKESTYNGMLKLGRKFAEDYLKKVDAQIAEAKELANKNTERYTYVPRGDQGVWGLDENDRPKKGIKPRSSWTLANLADRYDWQKKRWEVQDGRGRWLPTTWEDHENDRGGSDEGWVSIPQPPPPAKPPVITTSSAISVGGNPMVLAINIDTAYVEEDVVDAKSWNQNPMGVALAIEAPDPPVPQEPEPVQEGRCPPNPFWSTRFKSEDKQWYPFPDSRKQYRYGMSPVKPYGDTTSGGGETYSNTWKIDAPYSGFYKLKAAADDSAVIRLDGNEVLKTEGLSVDTTQLVGIDSGPHEITVEVTNIAQETFDSVNKRIFTTQGWASVGTDVQEALNTNEVEFSMWTNTQYANTLEVVGLDISYEKKFGGYPTQIRNEYATRKVEFGRVYDVKITSNNRRVTTIPSTNKELIIDGNGRKPGHSKVISPKILHFDDNANADGTRFDRNATFTIDKGNGTWAADGKSIKGTGEQTITLWWSDRGKSGRAINTIKIGSTTWQRSGSKGSVTHTTVLGGGEGVVGGENNKAVLRTKGENVLQMEDIPDIGEAVTYDDIIFTASQGRFYDINGLNAKYVLEKETKTVMQGGTGSGTVKGGVVYTGPELFHMTHKAWGPFMNKASLLMNPTKPSQGTVNYTFSNVDFPESGEYQVKFQNDAHGSLYLDGKEIVKGDFDAIAGVSARDEANWKGQGRFTNVLIKKGKHTLTVAPTGRLGRTDVPASTLFKIEEGYDFQKDAAGFAVEIRKNMQVVRTDGAGKPVAKSWKDNPVFVSAHLIPPPCPRRVRGKGAVKKITATDGGNGYSPPPTTGADPTYDVALELTNVIIEDGGINYSPDDEVVITGGPGDPVIPPFKPVLGKFGSIIDIPVPPTVGFTEIPDISIDSSTGVGVVPVPEFTPRRTPPLVDPDRLIQVTDLVGIKQTGYYDGKPYYGAVFYKDGTRYAGWYETAGQLVQIYDTLQESIDAMVTTPPSAIQRQGSDIRGNDPRLDIPGTPDNLTY